MSTQGLKFRRPGLLLDEEKGSATSRGAVRSSLVSATTARSIYSQSQWKLKQNIITGVVIAGMVANDLFCYRGRFHIANVRKVVPEIK